MQCRLQEGVYHSLSYQDTNLTKLGDREMPAVESTMLVRGSWMKSVDTTASLVYLSTPRPKTPPEIVSHCSDAPLVGSKQLCR